MPIGQPYLPQGCTGMRPKKLAPKADRGSHEVPIDAFGFQGVGESVDATRRRCRNGPCEVCERAAEAQHHGLALDKPLPLVAIEPALRLINPHSELFELCDSVIREPNGLREESTIDIFVRQKG